MDVRVGQKVMVVCNDFSDSMQGEITAIFTNPSSRVLYVVQVNPPKSELKIVSHTEVISKDIVKGE